MSKLGIRLETGGAFFPAYRHLIRCLVGLDYEKYFSDSGSVLLKQNGFTLIELLVVVAIIGILAAVGTVAYTGYTTAAKSTVTRNNLNGLTKYIKTEMISCLLNEKIYNNQYECSKVRNSSAKGIALGHATYSYAPSALNFKNPYNNKELAFKGGIAFVKGQTSISGSGNKIQLNTCLRDECKGVNNITTFVEVDVD